MVFSLLWGVLFLIGLISIWEFLWAFIALQNMAFEGTLDGLAEHLNAKDYPWIHFFLVGAGQTYDAVMG